MKTIKFLLSAFIFSIVTNFSVSSQTKDDIEIPQWCFTKAKEYVNKLKIDVSLTPADSAIIAEEYALRSAKTSKMTKEVSTPEEKKQVTEDCYKEFSNNLKKKLSPTVYSTYYKWQLEQARSKQ